MLEDLELLETEIESNTKNWKLSSFRILLNSFNSSSGLVNPIQRIESIQCLIYISYTALGWIQYKELKAFTAFLGVTPLMLTESNTKNWKWSQHTPAGSPTPWLPNPIQRIESYKAWNITNNTGERNPIQRIESISWLIVCEKPNGRWIQYKELKARFQTDDMLPGTHSSNPIQRIESLY